MSSVVLSPSQLVSTTICRDVCFVFAHVIPSAPWESFPEPTLQEFIPTSVNENLLDSRIAPCQVAFQFVIFFSNIFIDLLPNSLYSPLKITAV